MLDVLGVTDTERRELLESLEAGFALPSSWYTDRGLFDQERRRLLRRGWHYGAHTGELPEPGDQVLCQVAGVPVVLVAGEDGEIRGFVNICRHRAHIVVLEPGNRRTLQCHVPRLDVRARRLPAARTAAETRARLRPAELGLLPVQTAVWGPMVWVNVDRDARRFDDWIDGLPELVADAASTSRPTQFGVRGGVGRSAPTGRSSSTTPSSATTARLATPGSPACSRWTRASQARVGGRYWISHAIPFRQRPGRRRPTG